MEIRSMMPAREEWWTKISMEDISGSRKYPEKPKIQVPEG